MKKLKSILVIYILFFASSVYAQTATIKIRINNAPFLLIERHTFFKENKEMEVFKTSENEYRLKYYGKTPIMYNLNFRDILITPGDTVNLVYNLLDPGPEHARDTILAEGSHTGNYIFTNYIRLKPTSAYPDETVDKYKNDVGLFFNDLQKDNQKNVNMVATAMKKLNCDPQLTEYYKLKSSLHIFNKLYYYKDKFTTNPSKLKAVEELIDSIFLNGKYVESDTTYASFMETAFLDYFNKMVIPKFNNLQSANDFHNIVAYINRYPNALIKEYFVYFLATDYATVISKYTSDQLDEMIKINTHIGKIRNTTLDPSNFYN